MKDEGDSFFFFFFQAEDGIRDFHVTGVQTCALPICRRDKPVEEANKTTAPERRRRTGLPTVTITPEAQIRAQTGPDRSQLRSRANSCRRDKPVEEANKTTAPERRRRTGLPTVTI